MKKSKHLIALAITICLLLPMTVPEWAAERGSKMDYSSGSGFSKVNTYVSGQFSDIPDGQWYTQGVQTAYEYGLMSGISDTLFNPEGNLKMYVVKGKGNPLPNTT